MPEAGELEGTADTGAQAAKRSPMAWVEERVDLRPLREFVGHKVVPVHKHSYWYYVGGMTLFLFVVQVLTGILLLLYYQPSESRAFESVRYIMTHVEFGWLIRSIHGWCANLVMVLAFLHLFSTFFLKAYRKPRELTWVSGMMLLFVMLAFGFSGYLLPWNALSYFGTMVGTNMAGAVPFVGEFLLRFLRGGDGITEATLNRFFGFHVAILPAIVMPLLMLHLMLIQKQGMSVPMSIEQAHRESGTPLKSIKFFPGFLLRELMGWYIALAVLAALAALFPWELGERANPFAPAPTDIKPEWYFLFMFQTLKYIPAKVFGLDGEVLGILTFGVGALIVVLIPFIDRAALRGEKSKVIQRAGILVIIYILIMSVVSYVSGPAH